MVNYSYPELFYEHESVHWVIVNSSATVTGVSGDEPTITNADFVLTEEDLALEEMTIEESVCSLDNLSFGQCESSRVQFTMYTKQGLSSLEDVEIAIYLYFNEDSDTLFQVGVYIVDEDALSVDRSTREVVAYDVLYYLQDYDITEWYSEVYATETILTVKDLRDSLFEWLALDASEFTITQETTTLVNDDFAIEKSIESDTITFSFFMQHLLELNGVFGHIDRQGVFVYVSLDVYGTPSDAIIDDELIIPPVQYQDWNTRGIGYVIVYDRNNNKLAKIGTSSYRRPSNYTIVDSFVFYNNSNRANWQEDFEDAVTNLRAAITDRRYRSCEINCIGNLCLEAGDHITLQWNEYDDDDNVTVKTFKTYILERRFTGLQGFEDTYTANGDRRQPDYQVHNDNWHVGDNQINSVGGVTQLAEYASAEDFVEIIRNIGFRLLDEPNVLEAEFDSNTNIVHLKWEDPENIDTLEPVPCEWEGTVVVRKENVPPKHRWDGDLIADSTVRDAYKNTALADNTTSPGKLYYYGIFPYHIALDDTLNPIKHYRYTKTVPVQVSGGLRGVWEPANWSGVQDFYGSSVWTDNVNLYLSSGSGKWNYVYDPVNHIWKNKVWNGLPASFNVSYIWTDGTTVYYSGGSPTKQYTLNSATSTWTQKTWAGNYYPDYGNDVWTDGEDMFYNNGPTDTIKLNKSTGRWETIIIARPYSLLNFSGRYVWTDGINTYYSDGSWQGVLNKSSSSMAWELKTWSGLTRFSKTYIWKVGDTVYCSPRRDNTEQYVLNRSTSTWVQKVWYGFNPGSTGIWSDGTNIYNNYYSQSSSPFSDSYVLNPATDTWTRTDWEFEGRIDGSSVWKAGSLAYSDGTAHLALTPATYQISTATFNVPFGNFMGQYVWTDGENVYVSYLSNQYQFNVDSNTWTTKTWVGLTSFSAPFIWMDNGTVYYSSGNTQYVLDKSTSTWSAKTWNGLTNFTGESVWTDEENIYYSNGSSQYVLDRSTSTWSAKTWNGLTNFNGVAVWEVNGNVYYSVGSSQYVLDKSTSTWAEKTWEGLTEFSGQYIWKFGATIFYSKDEKQYVLT